MNPKKILIVDCNAVCYASYYTSGHLSYKEEGTGIIYGFFNQLQHICQSQQIAHIVFCWDSRQSRRKLLFPQYKENRTKKDPALLQCLIQFVKLRNEILPRLNFINNFHAVGFEADDLIASICRACAPLQDQQYIIASNDQDLYQLLTPQISLYKLSKKQLYTKQDFINEFGIDPLFWVDVKAIAGCPTDMVPGIKGIGEKKAVAYLKTYSNSFESHPSIDSSEGKKIRKRNRKLVFIPFEGTPIYELDWTQYPSFAEWLALCEELNFNSFLKNTKIWQNIFSGIAPQGDLISRLRIGKKSQDV